MPDLSMRAAARETRTAPHMSPAHAAAFYERPFLSPAGEEALRRCVAATDKIRREQYDAALNERGMDEYNAWAAGVAV